METGKRRAHSLRSSKTEFNTGLSARSDWAQDRHTSEEKKITAAARSRPDKKSQEPQTPIENYKRKQYDRLMKSAREERPQSSRRELRQPVLSQQLHLVLHYSYVESQSRRCPCSSPSTHSTMSTAGFRSLGEHWQASPLLHWQPACRIRTHRTDCR
jgi:hypothetical protein